MRVGSCVLSLIQTRGTVHLTLGLNATSPDLEFQIWLHCYALGTLDYSGEQKRNASKNVHLCRWPALRSCFPYTGLYEEEA